MANSQELFRFQVIRPPRPGLASSPPDEPEPKSELAPEIEGSETQDEALRSAEAYRSSSSYVSGLSDIPGEYRDLSNWIDQHPGADDAEVSAAVATHLDVDPKEVVASSEFAELQVRVADSEIADLLSGEAGAARAVGRMLLRIRQAAGESTVGAGLPIDVRLPGPPAPTDGGKTVPDVSPGSTLEEFRALVDLRARLHRGAVEALATGRPGTGAISAHVRLDPAAPAAGGGDRRFRDLTLEDLPLDESDRTRLRDLQLESGTGVLEALRSVQERMDRALEDGVGPAGSDPASARTRSLAMTSELPRFLFEIGAGYAQGFKVMDLEVGERTLKRYEWRRSPTSRMRSGASCAFEITSAARCARTSRSSTIRR